MTYEELLDKAITWFEEIAESTQHITTGNLSHEIATMRGKAIRCVNFIKKYIVDSYSKNSWRDTRKDPPQLKQSVILKSWSGRNTYYESLSTGDLQYIKENPELQPYWMLIPELSKGGEG